MELSRQQQALVTSAPDEKIFLSGKAGCGKTTAAVERIRFLTDHAGSWPNILVLTPSRKLGEPYREIISADGLRPQTDTFSGFIQHSLELFWPMVGAQAGFGFPERKPHFMTIEDSQVLMYKLVGEKIRQGYFGALTTPLSRVYNQVSMCLHKCAAACIPFDTYAERMKSSWSGDRSLLPIFDQAQECGMTFLNVCRRCNLLDYSLQVETFLNVLFPLPIYQDWLRDRQLHLVFDNAEEEVPAAHEFVRRLMPLCRSALIVTDKGGGYRNFLGADPASAASLGNYCPEHFEFEDSFVCSPAVSALEQVIADPKCISDDLPTSPHPAFRFQSESQYPAMIKSAAASIGDLIHTEGVSPSEIVVLAPLVSDVLYTSLERSLREQGIPVYLHRPSRPLVGESVTRSLVVLCGLADPESGLSPRPLDIVQMLQVFITGLDPVRGHLLVSRAFKEDPETGQWEIKPFSELSASARSRIPGPVAERFEILRQWIETHRTLSETPDMLTGHFFNEVLIREGFASENETNLGLKKMIESGRAFRETLRVYDELPAGLRNELPTWTEFFEMVGLGMVSASYYEECFEQPEGSILVSLTSAYLSMDRPVKYQFWLNVSSPRWWERFYGQLTNDAVLSPQWPEGAQWTGVHANNANDEHMTRQLCGLLCRCKSQIRAFASETSESGQDQRSKLLYLFNELEYRFDPDKPSDPVIFDFPKEIREDQPIYPGINDEASRLLTEDDDASYLW